MRRGLRGLTLRDFGRKLYRDLVDDAVSDTAAQLAYYFLFSLFPFLFFLVTVSAYLPLKDSASQMIDRIAYLMPDAATALLREHLDTLLGETRPKLVTFGLVTSVWTASRGVDALRKAMNLAYGVTESRPYWRTQLMAVVTTIAGAAGLILAIGALALGGRLGKWITQEYALIDEVYLFWSWTRWPLMLLAVMVSAGFMYWLLPNKRLPFRLLTAGNIFGAVVWAAATWLFTEYADNFGRFNVTYGSIGGVIVLMLWLYISGLVLILGGEINALLDAHDPTLTQVSKPEERVPVPVGAAKHASSARRLRKRIWRLFRRSHA